MNHWTKFIKRLIHGKTLVYALIIGILVGLLIVAFNSSIMFVFSKVLTFYNLHQDKIYLLPIITALGGLVSGLLVFKFAPETAGSGIPYIKLCLNDGKIVRLRSIVVKFFAGLSAIGSGLSLGREGPSVQLGAGVGALVNKLFKVKGLYQNRLIASGAGAAIAATFNAPIAGTVFVFEEMLHKFSHSIILPTMVSAVVAADVVRGIMGDTPAFNVNMIALNLNIENIIICIILGLIAGIFGVLFARTILITNKISKSINKIPNWFKPAIAGLIVGLVAIFLPQILGSGNLTVEELFDGRICLQVVFLIFIVKFFLTAICFSSGAAGGIFLPTLMLGAFLGYAVAQIANLFSLDVNPIAFATIGMGAFLSSVARTPITAMIMVFEMTGGYSTILPIMLASAIADATAQKMAHRPIYSTLAFNLLKEEKE